MRFKSQTNIGLPCCFELAKFHLMSVDVIRRQAILGDPAENLQEVSICFRIYYVATQGLLANPLLV